MTGAALWESVCSEARRRGADPAELRRLVLAPLSRGGAGWDYWYEEKTTPQLAAWLRRELDEMTKAREDNMSKPDSGGGAPKVYAAIAAVQRSLASQGIAKERSNQQQGFKFRGIEDVYNAMAPLLAEHGLCILPRVLSRHISERQTAKGGTLYSVAVAVEFDLVAAADGSMHTVKTFGEAMDSGDKATNKAMSAAWKYMAFMTFAIPTEASEDPDATTHEPTVPAPPPPKPAAPAKSAATNGNGQLHMTTSPLPQTPAELGERLGRFDLALEKAGLCRAGELLDAVEAAARAENIGNSSKTIHPDGFARAVQLANQFADECAARRQPQAVGGAA